MADTVVKIVTREQLTEYVSADRRAGRSIAFANGCFDLLHVGHVRYLQAAAAEADRLIVAVNDDATAATKGPGRPILKAGDRAELVAALRGVDYVTIPPWPRCSSCCGRTFIARGPTTRPRPFPNARRCSLTADGSRL